MSNTHAGIIAIVGRPNVGKSTLLNALLGQKVSITSKKPQTTRHRITGILTEDNCQAVFIDTPGLHKEEKRAINRLMNRAASSSLGSVELVLFVVDGTQWTEDDELVLTKLSSIKAPVIMVVNKEDRVRNKTDLLPFLAQVSQRREFAEIMPVSALKGDNVSTLKKRILTALPECEFLFPEDYITDRSSRFMAAEVVREKLMRFTGDELPYSVTVEIERFEIRDNGTYHINALILVERDSQKKMVIGRGGERMKTIGTEARRDLERLFESKVFLELWVKVKSGWADDERALRSLGYGED